MEPPPWIRELGPEAWCCCDHPSCDAEERISRSRSRAAASWSQIIRCSPRLLLCSPPCTSSGKKIVDGFRAIAPPVAVIDRPPDVLRAERSPFIGTDDRAHRMDGRVREGVGGAPRAQSRQKSRTLKGGPGHEPSEHAPSSRSRMPRARSSIAASSIGLSAPRNDRHPHAPAHGPGRMTKKAVSWSRCFRAGHPESGTGPSAYGRQPRERSSRLAAPTATCATSPTDDCSEIAKLRRPSNQGATGRRAWRSYRFDVM